MVSSMEKPYRMCMVCRERKPKNELVRIVKNQDGIKVDKTGKVDGRGAYICKEGNCCDKLVKTKALNKTFRENFSIDVYNEIMEKLKI